MSKTDSIEYRVASGARIKPADAQRLGEAIASLRSATPERLINAARPKNSPIHHLFNWDDKTAADSWRVEQAKYYIRSITLVFETPKESIETRAFHVVTYEDTGERGAVPAAEVFATPSLAKQAIDAALRELHSWRRRYAMYQRCAELSDVFDAIDRASLQDTADAAE